MEFEVMECKIIQKQLLNAQRNEISEYYTYAWLAERIRNTKNREVLEGISKEEYQHYELLKSLTQRDTKPRKLRVFWYKLISLVFGLSFGLRLMEQGEEIGQNVYYKLKEEHPELAARDLDAISEEDKKHTKVDIERAYNNLIHQWLHYMQYTRAYFPYFFLFAMRTNPFDEKASWLDRWYESVPA